MTTQQILFLDIETAPEYETFEEIPADGQAAFKRKVQPFLDEGKYPSIEYWYKEKAALYPEFSRIVCIGIAIVYLKDSSKPESEALSMRCLTGTEVEILTALTKFIDFTVDNNRPRFDFACAHNGMRFDFPFIGRRYTKHGIPVPKLLDARFKKPWETSMLDTVKIWAFTETNAYVSLITLCYVLGIESPKQGMDGSMVSEYWFTGRYQEIYDYCMLDVPALVNCYRRLMGEPVFTHDLIELKK